MGVTIRLATVEDVDAFVAMKNAAWRWAYADILPAEHLAALPTDTQVTGWCTQLAASADNAGVEIAVVERAIVGVVSYGPTRDEDAPEATGEIGMLYVLPDHVGTGLGRRLLERALDGLGRGGAAPPATLWVLEANARGRGFYERMGWRPDGDRSTHMVECASFPMLRYVIEL
jgi:GNAT superfamily N-acetyltransferase